MDKLTARGLDATGLADGHYVINVVGGKVTGWVAAPAGVVAAVVPGSGISVDNTDPTHPIVAVVPATTRFVPLTTVVGGEPCVVWDSNDEIVWTEIPL